MSSPLLLPGPEKTRQGRARPTAGRGHRFVILRLLLTAAVLTGCGQTAASRDKDTLQITVSILPQKYFVERIGGEHVSVNVMVEPGASPATYEPKPEQLRALGQADAYISIGVPFEDAWLERMLGANPDMLVVDTTQGIEKAPMGARHRSGEGSEKTESQERTLDPHIWLSPRLVRIQAQTIHDALVGIDSKHKQDYQSNLDSFLADIDALDADIRGTLSGVENGKFIVFHPAWGYFADDYALEMIPIEVGGQEPSAAELAALITEAREEGIKVIFAQPEFSTRAAETVAQEIGGKVLLISPLAPDWLGNLRSVADTLARYHFTPPPHPLPVHGSQIEDAA